MQSPDVNVLVSAFREDAVHHGCCRSWLTGALSGRERIGLSELALSGVLRVLTHSRVFHPPTPTEAALDFVDALLAQPASLPLRPGDAHWRIFRGMCATLRTDRKPASGCLSRGSRDRARLRVGDSGPRLLHLSRLAFDKPAGRLMSRAQGRRAATAPAGARRVESRVHGSRLVRPDTGGGQESVWCPKSAPERQRLRASRRGHRGREGTAPVLRRAGVPLAGAWVRGPAVSLRGAARSLKTPVALIRPAGAAYPNRFRSVKWP